ncbi:MAG: hypothetical protein V4492_08790 [Chlamydiota bacterium]
MAAISHTEINFERLWELSNNAGAHHSKTSEIAGTIYSIENANVSSSSDMRTPEQKAQELAQNKARVIAWAKEQFPNLLSEGPEKLYDPITCGLFVAPQTHLCGKTEHTLEPEAFKKTRAIDKEKFIQTIKNLPQYLLIESVFLKYFEHVEINIDPIQRRVSTTYLSPLFSPYEYEPLLQSRGRAKNCYTRQDAKYAVRNDIRSDHQLFQADQKLNAIVGRMTTVDLHHYVIEQEFCPYTRGPVTNTLNDQLQHEVYRFVLTRMGVLNTPPSIEMHSSSSTTSEPAPLGIATSTIQVRQNPVGTLRKIGGLVSRLINEFGEPGSRRPLEHADQMADYCHTCAAKAGRLAPYVVNKGYEDIYKAIASLPDDIQSTLHFKTWERRGDVDTSTDPHWGKNHLLSNLHRTLSVMNETMLEQMAKPKRLSLN